MNEWVKSDKSVLIASIACWKQIFDFNQYEEFVSTCESENIKTVQDLHDAMLAQVFSANVSKTIKNNIKKIQSSKRDDETKSQECVQRTQNRQKITQNTSQNTTIQSTKPEKKPKIPKKFQNLKLENPYYHRKDEDILLSKHLKHLRFLTKCLPPTSIQFLWDAFRSCGFQFDESKEIEEQRLLYNTILSFPELQQKLLNEWFGEDYIIPMKDQCSCPHVYKDFGKLTDFCQVDMLYKSLLKRTNKTDKDPIHFSEYKFEPRPWKFHVGHDVIFTELQPSNTTPPLFEQLLLFTHKKNPDATLLLRDVEFWRRDVSIITLCFHLIVTLQFGHQYSLNPSLEPLHYIEYKDEEDHINGLDDYFLTIYADLKPLSIHCDKFQKGESFGETNWNLSSIVNPFQGKNSPIWIKKTDHGVGHTYQIYAFPKKAIGLIQEQPILPQTDYKFESSNIIKSKIQHPVRVDLLPIAAEWNDQVMYAMKTTASYYLYRVTTKLQYDDFLKQQQHVRLLFLQEWSIRNVCYLAELWYHNNVSVLIVSSLKDVEKEQQEDDDILLVTSPVQSFHNVKLVIMTADIFSKLADHNSIGLIFVMDNVTSSFQSFSSNIKHNYLVVTTRERCLKTIHWSNLQNMIFPISSIKTSSIAQTIVDCCSVYVHISDFTFERCQQDKEFAKMYKDEIQFRNTNDTINNINNTNENNKKRHLNSRLVRQFDHKKTKEC